MQADTSAANGECRSGKGKVRLATTSKVKDLSSLDRRTAAYRKTLQLISAIEADLGGPDQLSTAERQIIRHAALTSAMLEDHGTRWLGGEPVDPAVYCTLANSERRLYETVGLQRRQRDVSTLTLADVIKANEEARQAAQGGPPVRQIDGEATEAPSANERASNAPRDGEPSDG